MQHARLAPCKEACEDCVDTGGNAGQALPITLITDLKVLPSMRPVEGCGVVVGHPHEALAAQDCLDRAFALARVLTFQGCVGGYWQPTQHHFTQSAVRAPLNLRWCMMMCNFQSGSLKLPTLLLLSASHCKLKQGTFTQAPLCKDAHTYDINRHQGYRHAANRCLHNACNAVSQNMCC